MIALFAVPSAASKAAAPGPSAPVDAGPAGRPVSLLALAASFFRLGSTTFGGMWAATNAIEAELVHRARWLTTEELQLILLTANLIPAPKFLGLGGLVGYRLRGWLGSVVAVAALIAPGALLVLAAVVLVTPELLDGPLQPVRRTVGIAVVGLLFGNAYQQLRTPKVTGRAQAIGVSLGLAVAAATVAGIPLLVAALAGFAAGAVLIREGAERRGLDETDRGGQAS